MALLIAGEGGDRAIAVLQLVVRGAEPLPAPAGLEQGQQPVELTGMPCQRRIRAASDPDLLSMEALEDVVDEDPETLVDRRLLRDREDPRELVLQRTGPVEVDVGRREPEAVAALAPRQELLERRLAAGGDRARRARRSRSSPSR